MELPPALLTAVVFYAAGIGVGWLITRHRTKREAKKAFLLGAAALGQKMNLDADAVCRLMLGEHGDHRWVVSQCDNGVMIAEEEAKT